MNLAIIHHEPIFSKWNQIFFTKKVKEKIKREITILNKKVPVYLIPIIKEKPSEKAINQFILYLKEENIDIVLLSNDVECLPVAKEIKKHFLFLNGNKVINYRLYDILRKCADARNTELSKSTLIISAEEPEQVKQFILKVYKFVKKIKIQTNKPSLFSDLSAFFLYEYGLFIEIVKEVKKTDNEIIISLTEKSQQADVCFCNEKNTEIIFSVKNLLYEINSYKKLNQEMIEFLIYLLYNNIKEENIKRFFKTYSVRVVKLIK